ncbi:hypothetical protein EB796_005979 [Bugula neritina]|uniref:Uncharacterized protein n=1 Tax=Bugula neritina TaxID=10212 RepID=A0A7J7KCP7_BUGNE|nr:hypothetical protein EB796_005979 [Bugula neritina]
MSRPYGGAAGTHMFFGLLSIAAGISWICILYFYQPLFVDGKSILSGFSEWVSVVMSAKIICGFWIDSLCYQRNSYKAITCT